MDTGDRQYDWGWLNCNDCGIIPNITREWNKLLVDNTKKENDYHQFLTQHAGLFFGNVKCYQVISKLKLGSDHETDFIVFRDNLSYGCGYEIIEIETPHIQPYTQNGNPSSRLTHAIQQIMNWKRWIDDNRSLFSEYISPISDNQNIRDWKISYTIYIGRREKSNESRNQLSHELGIHIHSFDKLTDHLKVYREDFADFSGEISNLPLDVRNQLSNPFFIANSDSEWKEIRKEAKYTSHYFAWNFATILKYRKYNYLLNEFVKQYPNNIENAK